MRNIIYILLSLFLLGCAIDNGVTNTPSEIPTRNHDLSYIPFDIEIDNPDYNICDSTKIKSGRNRLKYVGGTDELKEGIISNYSYRQEYAGFNGYIVIRFLVNCEGLSGRYRAQSLNLDFSPSEVPFDLLEHSVGLVKNLDNWIKATEYGERAEYSKFINLKFENGRIQHVLL